MAFTDCPECGLGISERAAACPRCGFPMKPRQDVRYVTGLSALDAAKSIVGRVMMGAAVFAGGVSWDAPPVILCSLVIFGSTLPVWLKARKFERMRAGSVAPPVESVPQSRVAAVEAGGRRQVTELEQASQQVEDLQERLEFLERLVAKRHELS